jgi:hypothetical protein
MCFGRKSFDRHEDCASEIALKLVLEESVAAKNWNVPTGGETGVLDRSAVP